MQSTDPNFSHDCMGLVDAGWECSDKGKIIDTVVEHAFTRIHR